MAGSNVDLILCSAFERRGTQGFVFFCLFFFYLPKFPNLYKTKHKSMHTKCKKNEKNARFMCVLLEKQPYLANKKFCRMSGFAVNACSIAILRMSGLPKQSVGIHTCIRVTHILF